MVASFRHEIAACSPSLALGIGIVALLGHVGATQTVSSPRALHQAYGATIGSKSLSAMAGSDYGNASRAEYRPVFDPSLSVFPRSMLALAP